MTLWRMQIQGLLRKVVRALGVGMDPGPLRPVDRFEWERIVRRVQISSSTMLLALTLATYADSNGSRIRPGVDRLARVMCVSAPTVKRAFAELRRLGLVQQTKKGNRYASHADEYRLTVPSDMPDYPMLDPDECEMSGDHQ